MRSRVYVSRSRTGEWSSRGWWAWLGCGRCLTSRWRPTKMRPRRGYTVFWEPAHYPADDIEAELPDGTRLTAILQFGDRRVGFERPLPKGTQLLLRGQPAWRPIGETDKPSRPPSAPPR